MYTIGDGLVPGFQEDPDRAKGIILGSEVIPFAKLLIHPAVF
jgi:hypothetical protein